ncbi:carbohydrate ABC transporter substrate-binding protein, CUT1 family [Seinonella peptonophila]|uniref:Carbohydrate ABC transporter substrate-binding protein, CUT1 family n=1 Tax=Seinonella peptonophila TaxID=112248 RepID=A0A1M4T474_9BACL|nr:sugar ABC transporter substrate-binding protein [Seinonella peptonophila]SHE39302.1 carbohydrate ABC transporter substrate-binding protein, CUT1 family [Seinonella peptonophila]
MKWTRFFVMSGLAILLIIQTACSSGSDDTVSINGKERIKLTFWDMHAQKEQEFFKKLVDQYNKSQEKVFIEYSTFNQVDYTTAKLPTAFANGEGPDIFMVSPGDFMKFAKAGTMADLTPYFPKGTKEDFVPTSLEAVTLDNKIYALPYELELLGLFYNKEMLKKANIQVPKTWDELRSAAKKLKNDKVSGLILPYEKGPYLNFVWYPFLWQLGGNVLSNGGNKSTFDSPQVAQALDFWGSFFKEGLAPKTLQIPPTDIDHLGNKSAAMQVVGTWAITAAETKFPNVPIDVAPLPIPAKGKAATDAGGWKMAVNAKGKNTAEAAKFIMWAFASDQSRPLEWCTKTKFAYSPRKSVVEKGKDIYTKGMRKVFTEQIYNSAIPEPRYAPGVTEPIGDALQKVMFENITGSNAALEGHKKINETLSKE